MGSGKSFVKGLAAGAALLAVAKVVMDLKADKSKTNALKKAAHDVMSKVKAHAKKVGRLSKSAYKQVVESTVAEYKGAKAMTKDELAELKEELLSQWENVTAALKKE